MVERVAFKVVDWVRPWPDQAHFAAKDIPELRKFIEAVTSQDPAEAGNPGIVGQLEGWAQAFVLATKRLFHTIGIYNHGAEFAAKESSSFLAHARGAVDCRA